MAFVGGICTCSIAPCRRFASPHRTRCRTRTKRYATKHEMTKPICLTPIGIIHSPFRELNGMPIQAAAAQGVAGTIELEPAYADGLKDIEGFSHLTLIFYLHLTENPALQVTPYLDDVPHGVFATRSPKRPNQLGISTVRLVRVDGLTLHVQDLDIVDGTPLLDIKPYVPQFDHRDEVRIGWFEKNIARMQSVRAGERPPIVPKEEPK